VGQAIEWVDAVVALHGALNDVADSGSRDPHQDIPY
jgi:hypothetical protein